MIGLTLICLALIAVGVVRERAWSRERASLIQRIQAPAQAVAAHASSERPRRSPSPIPVDDDAAFKAAREARDNDRG